MKHVVQGFAAAALLLAVGVAGQARAAVTTTFNQTIASFDPRGRAAR
jgi:hypothetical protein